MAYELKEGQGKLWPNDKKKTEKSPSMTGEALINGVLMEISAWTKVSQNSGKEYLSISIKPKQQNGGYQQNGGQQRQYKQPANNNHQYQQAAPAPAPQPAQQVDDMPSDDGLF